MLKKLYSAKILTGIMTIFLVFLTSLTFANIEYTVDGDSTYIEFYSQNNGFCNLDILVDGHSMFKTGCDEYNNCSTVFGDDCSKYNNRTINIEKEYIKKMSCTNDEQSEVSYCKIEFKNNKEYEITISGDVKNLKSLILMENVKEIKSFSGASNLETISLFTETGPYKNYCENDEDGNIIQCGHYEIPCERDENGDIIECGYYNGLQRLTQEENTLENIKKGAFAGLTKLKTLNLTHNNLKSIEANTFSDLNNLEYLYLNDNEITSLYNNSFNGLNKLKYLYLSNNQISNLNNNYFIGLNSLTNLYINENKIQKIGNGTFSNLSGLERLEINFNTGTLKTIEAYAFSGLNSLKRLELKNNIIDDIKGHAFYGLKKIGNIDLSNNKINQLKPHEYETQTETIKEYQFDNICSGNCNIYLTNNELTTIPESIINLPDDKHKLKLILPNNSTQTIGDTGATYTKTVYLQRNDNINYVSILNPEKYYNSVGGENLSFNRIGYTHYPTRKYIWEIYDQNEKKIIQTGDAGNDTSTYVNVGEGIWGNFRVYITAEGQRVASGNIDFFTEDNSYIKIKDTENYDIPNDRIFTDWNLTLNIEGHHGDSTPYYVYELKKNGNQYTTGQFTGGLDSTNNDTRSKHLILENGEYEFDIKMYNKNDTGQVSPKASETVTFSIQVPYEYNIFEITNPATDGILFNTAPESIKRNRLWTDNYYNKIKGFKYKIEDPNGNLITSGTIQKHNSINSSGYSLNTNTLTSGSYTISIDLIDNDNNTVPSKNQKRQFNIGSSLYIITPKNNATITGSSHEFSRSGFSTKDVQYQYSLTGNNGFSETNTTTDTSKTFSNLTGGNYTFTINMIESGSSKPITKTVNFNIIIDENDNGNNQPGTNEAHTLTINYKYTNGNTAHNSHTETYTSGSRYSIKSPTINGYTPSEETVSGYMPNQDKTINVTYTANQGNNPGEQGGSQGGSQGSESTYTLTIAYMVGGATYFTRTVTGTAGSAYYIESPSIPQYTADKEIVAGIFSNDNIREIVTYTANNSGGGGGGGGGSSSSSTPNSSLSIDYPTDRSVISSLPMIIYWDGEIDNYIPTYKYRLYKDGRLEEASNTSSSSIKYSNLSNGNYKFQIDMYSSSSSTKLKTATVNFVVDVDNSDSSSSSLTNDEENFIELSTNRKSPTTDQYINLTIKTAQSYKDRLYFYLQYRQDSSDGRLSISNTYSTYVSDYSDDWEKGFYKMKSSDAGEITLKNIVKFKKSGQYKIYVKDAKGNSKSIQFNVSGDDDEDEESSSSTKSNLSISLTNQNPDTNSRIGLILDTSSDYVGKISFPKIEYYSSSRRDVSSSSEYIGSSSDERDDGYYKMTARDYGYKRISNFIKLKKEGKYRIHAKATDGATDYVQFYVDESDDDYEEYERYTESETTSESEGITQSEIEEMINRILNPTGTTNNYNDYNYSYSGGNYSYQNDNGVERNKNNIGYMPDETYKSRSCKEYKLHYDSDLGVFTSPNLQKTEYFISKDYFKRYIDSKNKQKEGCPTNTGRISTNYNDSSTSSENFIAPNGKVYFIQHKDGKYYSNNLNSEKDFPSLIELKFYIKDRNPLINMSS